MGVKTLRVWEFECSSRFTASGSYLNCLQWSTWRRRPGSSASHVGGVVGHGA